MPRNIHKINLCAKFHNSSIICVVRIDGQKNQNGQILNFIKIGQKFILAKKYF